MFCACLQHVCTRPCSASLPLDPHPSPHPPHGNILAVDLVTKNRNTHGLWTLSSLYPFSYHFPHRSQYTYVSIIKSDTAHKVMLDPNVRRVLSDRQPATTTTARHGPLGLHSDSGKTRSGWYKTTQVQRNTVGQTLPLTDYLCLADGWWNGLVGGTIFWYDIFLSPLTDMLASQLCSRCLMWMWVPIQSANGKETLYPLPPPPLPPSRPPAFPQQHIHHSKHCTER